VAVSGWRANLYGSVAVLALIAAISYGLPAVDAALPDNRVIPAGSRITVGHGVSEVPPRGSLLDSAETSPNDGRLVLEVHGARYRITVSPYEGTLREATVRLRERIGALPGYQITGPSYWLATDDGVVGMEGRFGSARRDGYFAVFVSGGLVVEVVAQGVGFALSGTLADVQRSVATIHFGVAG
jgi:hypothetical protein